MDRFVNRRIEKQTIYEIYRACRLCGAGGGYKMPIIQNVVNVDNCDVELKQKIRECVQIEVHQDDKMPPLICELCVDKVNDFYEFLEMCKQTNIRTRLKLGLPPQMLPRGAPDAGDCILGVTEPIFINDEDSNEPLSDKRNKTKGGKIKKEPEKKWKDANLKLETCEPRASRQRPSNPPRLRRDRRPHTDDGARDRLQPHAKTSSLSPPKSILKKGINKKPEHSCQSPSTRLKRSREVEVKPETTAKRVKISLRPVPSKASKAQPLRILSQRMKREEEEERKARQNKEEAEKHARGLQAPCLVCGAVFKTSQALASHRRSHVVTYTDPRLACNACELWFASAEETERHHQRHRRQMLRYRCRRCGRNPTTLLGYEEHIEKGKCVPWEEVPDVKCNTCWKTFPTRNLLAAHHCAGVAARPGKCAKCGKNYATQKSLSSHTRSCRKGNVMIAPELRVRLKPIQVRVARCDPLLANVKQEHYDVSSVETNFGLDKNCIYPYKSSGLSIKSEPTDCMVKINDLDFGGYVHWDSDDDSGDSDFDNIDSLDVTVFGRKRKVASLAACALKIIFSNKCLGKVPRKFRRVKMETVMDFALNDSLSELNLNDSDSTSLDRNDTSSGDKFNDSDKIVTKEENDVGDGETVTVVSGEETGTNGDVDGLFRDNNDNTDIGDRGETSVVVSESASVLLAAPDSHESKDISITNVLSSGAEEAVDKERNHSNNVTSNNNNIDVADSTKESVDKNAGEEISSVLESAQSEEDLSTINCEQKILVNTNLNSDLDEAINTDGETKSSETRGVNFNHSKIVNLISFDECNRLGDRNKLKELLGNHCSETNVNTDNKLSENNKVLSFENDKIDHLEKLDRMQTEITINSEPLDTITQAPAGNVNTNITQTPKDSDGGDGQVNGDVGIDGMALNMNDLEELSGNEFDDCALMAEIDAQIGERNEEEVRRAAEVDEQQIKRGPTVETENVIVMKHIQIGEQVTGIGDNVSGKPVKEEQDNTAADAGSRQDKITLEDLLPEQNEKSMDLDSISDEDFDFND